MPPLLAILTVVLDDAPAPPFVPLQLIRYEAGLVSAMVDRVPLLLTDTVVTLLGVSLYQAESVQPVPLAIFQPSVLTPPELTGLGLPLNALTTLAFTGVGETGPQTGGFEYVALFGHGSELSAMPSLSVSTSTVYVCVFAVAPIEKTAGPEKL